MKKANTASVFLILIITGLYVAFCFIAPVKAISPTITYGFDKPVTTSSKVIWPNGGESALAVLGTSVSDSHSQQTPLPTASAAKMITALMVLKAKPLILGQQGPEVPITQVDVNFYDAYAAEQGSIVPVQIGEQISEYQMLEAMLLPSGNNIADSLAVWSYGSLSSYASSANEFLAKNGLTSTHVGNDASGFDPSTLSTATDLVRLGELVEANPVLAQIVAEPYAGGIPVAGTIHNVNSLLGHQNVIGIKTGNNDQDQGVFVGASRQIMSGKPVTIISAYMGASSLANALSSSDALLASSQTNFVPAVLVAANSDIAYYHVPWEKNTVLASNPTQLSGDIWGGKTVMAAAPRISDVRPGEDAGSVVGYLNDASKADFSGSRVKVILESSISQPSVFWKLLHPQDLHV
ncbi:MAG TPA: hypothetical protein VFN51_00070 [Candidatus Saccharimonadales bacterium]|nr:hypothetical protein [Candidatus Saccharimonadales bacterium]